MKKILSVAAAAAMVATTGLPVMAPAQAHTTTYPHHHRYHGKTYYARKHCRYSNGTTGLIAGGAAGAVVGSKVLGGGLLGVAAGAVGGAVAGRAVDRSMTAQKRCYYR
jgi:hypothetical protein